MATEDFSTYTEVDPRSEISKTSTTITFTGLDRDTPGSYVYSDKGSAHFAGDFSHDFEIRINSFSGSALPYLWCMTNSISTFADASNGLGVFWYGGDSKVYIREHDGGAGYQSGGVSISTATTYYCTARRDESVGTYGTFYLSIYSDSGRTTLVGSTQSLALHTSKKDYQYIYGLSNWNAGGGTSATGTVANLDLKEGISVSAAQTLPSFTQTATATVLAALAAAQTLGAITQSAAAEVIAALSAGQTLADLSQSAAATVAVALAATQQLPIFGQSAALDTGNPALEGGELLFWRRRRRR